MHDPTTFWRVLNWLLERFGPPTGEPVELGVCVDYCGGCLALMRHIVKARTTSKRDGPSVHLMERRAYALCEGCGGTRWIESGVTPIDPKLADFLPMELTARLNGIVPTVALRSDSRNETERQRHIIEAFATGQEGAFDGARTLALAIFFGVWGTVVLLTVFVGISEKLHYGIILMIAGVTGIALLPIIAFAYHGKAASEIAPRIAALVERTKAPFRLVEQLATPRLRRHLRTRHYARFRRAGGRIL